MDLWFIKKPKVKKRIKEKTISNKIFGQIPWTLQPNHLNKMAYFLLVMQLRESAMQKGYMEQKAKKRS